VRLLGTEEVLWVITPARGSPPPKLTVENESSMVRKVSELLPPVISPTSPAEREVLRINPVAKQLSINAVPPVALKRTDPMSPPSFPAGAAIATSAEQFARETASPPPTSPMTPPIAVELAVPRMVTFVRTRFARALKPVAPMIPPTFAPVATILPSMDISSKVSTPNHAWPTRPPR
jgi:hypothetical protein